MKNKIRSIVSILFGLVFLNAGLNKFFNYMPVPDDLPENLMALFQHFTAIGWLLPLIGVAEIAGGILVVFRKTRALGAVVIFPVMLGILLTHIISAPSGLPMAVILFAINLWLLYENRKKYAPMIA